MMEIWLVSKSIWPRMHLYWSNLASYFEDTLSTLDSFGVLASRSRPYRSKAALSRLISPMIGQNITSVSIFVYPMAPIYDICTQVCCKYLLLLYSDG